MWNSLWTGEGFIDFKTKLSGKGKAIFNTMGPVEEVHLNDSIISIDGTQVIGRTDTLTYKVRLIGKSLLSKFLSGEKLMCIFEGTGKLLITRAPFYRMRLLKAAERK
jgi:uncharacterized protein (AIM24 family)